MSFTREYKPGVTLLDVAIYLMAPFPEAGINVMFYDSIALEYTIARYVRFKKKYSGMRVL